MDLSIIIPVYNTPSQYLKDCFRSIQESNMNFDYEVLIINDGSTNEETLALLNNYSERHTIIITKNNNGVSSARNIGINKAQGNYLLFLDADDILLPEINNAIKFLKKNEDFDLVYCDTIYFGDQKFYYKKGRFSIFKLFYIGNFLNISTLIKTNIAKKYSFDESMQYAEDYDFWCRIANDGHNFKYLPKPFFMYRRILDGKSLSQIPSENKNIKNKLLKKKFDVNKIITHETVNQYIINIFKDNKALFVKLTLMLFFPGMFKILLNLKIYRNDYLSD